jgi:hypothetical protein
VAAAVRGFDRGRVSRMINLSAAPKSRSWFLAADEASGMVPRT